MDTDDVREVPVAELNGEKPEGMVMIKVVDLRKIVENSTTAVSLVTQINEKFDDVATKTAATHDIIRVFTTNNSGATSATPRGGGSRAVTKGRGRGATVSTPPPPTNPSPSLISTWMTHRKVSGSKQGVAVSSSTDLSPTKDKVVPNNSTPKKINEGSVATNVGGSLGKKRKTVVKHDRSHDQSNDSDEDFCPSDDYLQVTGDRRKSARISASTKDSSCVSASTTSSDQLKQLKEETDWEERFADLQNQFVQKEKLKMQSPDGMVQKSAVRGYEKDEDIFNIDGTSDDDNEDAELKAVLKVSWDEHLKSLAVVEANKIALEQALKDSSSTTAAIEDIPSTSKVTVEDVPGARKVRKVKGGVVVSWNGEINDGQPIDSSTYRQHVQKLMGVKKIQTIEQLWGTNPEMPQAFYFEVFGATVNRICTDLLSGLRTDLRAYIEGSFQEVDNDWSTIEETIAKLPEPVKAAMKTTCSIFFKGNESEETRSAQYEVVKASIEESKSFVKCYQYPLRNE